MSVEALSIALHHSQAKGAALLMLIGIANHSGDGGAWPALATLMRYARVTDRRGAQRALRSLETLGEIRTHIQAGGDEDMADGRRPNRYTFMLRCPADCDGSMQHRSRTSVQLFETGGAQTAPSPEQGRSQHRGRGGAQTALTIHEPPTTNTQRKNLTPVDVRARERSRFDRIDRRCADLGHDYLDSGYCSRCGERQHEASA